MSYHYSYSQTTTTSTSVDGQTSTRTVTRTTTSSDTNGPHSTVTIRELAENELDGTLLETTQDYEISDEDRLTPSDFYMLMDSEDETESEESDIEDYWFPSLLKHSFIQLLDDKEDHMDDDTYDVKALIEENESNYETEEEEEEEHMIPRGNGKRYYKRHPKKNNKKSKKSEQVPVEVLYVRL